MRPVFYWQAHLGLVFSWQERVVYPRDRSCFMPIVEGLTWAGGN